MPTSSVCQTGSWIGVSTELVDHLIATGWTRAEGGTYFAPRPDGRPGDGWYRLIAPDQR